MAEECTFRFDSLLLDHIKFGRNNKANSMLNEKLAKKSDNFGTLLHWAAVYDNIEIIHWLIELGADIDFLGASGETALMIAVQNECVATLKVLLEAGANIEIVDANGQNVLQMVFHEEYFETGIIEAFIYKLRSDISDNYFFASELEDAGCSAHHTIILKDLDVINKMLHSYYFQQPNAVKRLDAVVIFINLELDSRLSDENNELDDCVLNHVYGTIAFPEGFEYNSNELERHLIEHGVLPQTHKSYSYMVITRPDGVEITPFQDDLDKFHTLIAHIMMLEKHGKSVFKNARCFEAVWRPGRMTDIEKYHEICQQMLDIIMFGTSTISDLLNDQNGKLRTFVRNQTFSSIIEKVCSKHGLKETIPYYYKSLMIRIKRANKMVKLEDAAITVVCKIFNRNYNECYTFARQVVSYLNKKDLERLCLICD